MRRRIPKSLNSIVTMGALLLCGLPLFAQSKSSPEPIVRHAVSFGVSAPVRDLAKLPIPHQNAGSTVGAMEQRAAADGSNFTIGINVAGIGMGFPNFTSDTTFPDANIAVGDTQIVQVVNASGAVFDKTTGAALTPAMPISSLWSRGDCSTNNSGHVIVQWDKAAHRWLIAQNVLDNYSGPYSACIAISTSADATGAYYLYEFPFVNGGYPDLQKWGVWTNSYFQSNDNFGPNGDTYIGAEPCAYDRTKMLAGDRSAMQVCFQLSNQDFALLPGDIDSAVPPPANQDEFLFSLAGDSSLALYSVNIDWSNPNGATITGNGQSQLFSIPPFLPACNGQYLGYCVPQQGSDNDLEVLGDRLLYRVVYYDDPPLISVLATPPKPLPSQHWLVLHDVTRQTDGKGDPGPTPQAERWYEFKARQTRSMVTDITLFQSGTYAPGDANSRWMGSIARDKNSNIMMGYSESGPNMYPSIAITGRLLSDPLGQMEDERIVFNGTAPQTDPGSRWGNYSSMRLDPDGCTLWYTSEYYLTPVGVDWSTQISSATFAGCQP